MCGEDRELGGARAERAFHGISDTLKGFKQASTCFIPESLWLLRMGWSRASREDGNQTGGYCNSPGETLGGPCGAMMLELLERRDGFSIHSEVKLAVLE